MILRPASDDAQYMRPVIVNRFPTPGLDFRNSSWIYLLRDNFCRRYCEWWSCQIQETGMNVRMYLITDAIVSIVDIRYFVANWNTLERNAGRNAAWTLLRIVVPVGNSKRDCVVEALPIVTCERLNLMTSVRKERLRAWSLLLLAAAVRSFARMPLGISDRNRGHGGRVPPLFQTVGI